MKLSFDNNTRRFSLEGNDASKCMNEIDDILDEYNDSNDNNAKEFVDNLNRSVHAAYDIYLRKTHPEDYGKDFHGNNWTSDVLADRLRDILSAWSGIGYDREDNRYLDYMTDKVNEAIDECYDDFEKGIE